MPIFLVLWHYDFNIPYTFYIFYLLLETPYKLENTKKSQYYLWKCGVTIHNYNFFRSFPLTPSFIFIFYYVALKTWSGSLRKMAIQDLDRASQPGLDVTFAFILCVCLTVGRLAA